MHDSRAVANEFILRAENYRENSEAGSYFLSSLEIQKLTTLAHAFHYLTENGAFMVHEPLTIGHYEPRFKSLAIALEFYGDSSVDKLIVDGEPDDVFSTITNNYVKSHFSNSEMETIDFVWSKFLKCGFRCERWSYIFGHFTAQLRWNMI